MKYLKRFNEAIVVPDKEMLKKIYSEIEEKFKLGNAISFSDLKEISSKYDIEILTYNEFYNSLSDYNKSEAPPKGIIMFGYTNAETGTPCVILNTDFMTRQMFSHFKDCVEHELVHTGHISKRRGWYPSEDKGPGNAEAYFSDSSEVMAMSKSISYLIIQMDPNDIKEAIKMMRRVPLYQHISNTVSDKLLKRYHKYIYLYLEDHFNKN